MTILMLFAEFVWFFFEGWGVRVRVRIGLSEREG